MVVDIHKLVAAISPDVFCNPSVRSEVKKMVKNKLNEGNQYAYLDVAKEKAKLVNIENYDFVQGMYTNTSNYLPVFKNPIEKHKFGYDSFNEGMESIYFWILEVIAQFGLFKIDKLIDNYLSTPGSGHFSEMGQKATRMQEEAMKMLGSANQVVKSILNILYDLKEFEIRLGVYEKFNSKDKFEKEAALFSLKQIWLDTVDAKRGNSSIKGLALTQANFVTLIDAFMAVEDERLKYQGVEIDLNDRVKRLLKQRILEFNLWVKESEKELRKRFEIEKIYLKSQANTVKLYARWIKPYLRAAQKLEQRASDTPYLVNMFNSTLFEIVLLARGEFDPNDMVAQGELPKLFKNSNKREYSPLMIIEFSYKSYPERLQSQGYGFRGKVEVTLTSYGLNDEEVKILKKMIEKDDLDDLVSILEKSTDESLGKVQEEIDHFLNEKEKKDEKKKEVDSDPFSELFSFLKIKKEEKKDESKGIKPDSEIDKVLRARTIIDARKRCNKFYYVYKKAHGMAGFDSQEEVF